MLPYSNLPHSSLSEFSKYQKTLEKSIWSLLPQLLKYLPRFATILAPLSIIQIRILDSTIIINLKPPSSLSREIYWGVIQHSCTVYHKAE